MVFAKVTNATTGNDTERDHERIRSTLNARSKQRIKKRAREFPPSAKNQPGHSKRCIFHRLRVGSDHREGPHDQMIPEHIPRAWLQDVKRRSIGHILATFLPYIDGSSPASGTRSGAL